MQVEHDPAAHACVAALHALLAAAEELDDEALLVPSRCRGWSRLDTLVHVHTGLQEMLLGMVTPTDAAPEVDAATYWRTDLLTNDDAATAVDQITFLHRLSAAYRRPTGAVGHLRQTVTGLAGAVPRMTPGRVRFQDHAMTTGDFLATWATEVAVHHLDLDLAAAAPGPDPDALRLARRTAEALAGHPIEAADDAGATLRGWGRQS